MRARRLAFSHYSVADDVGGVTTWLENFLIRLNGHGYEPVVLLHHIGSDVGSSRLLASLRGAGIEVEIKPRSSTLDGDVRDTLNFLNSQKPLVFVPHCLSAMCLAAAKAGVQGLPWVLTIHSDDPDYWAIADSVRAEQAGGTLVGVSEYIGRKAIELGIASRPQIIPCGVPASSSSTSFSDAPFGVIFAGRIIEEQKRFSLVLATMAEACRRDRRVHCVVAGRGPAQAAAVDLVSEWGLSDRIQFLGPLSPHGVQAELAKAQVILLMSDFEGLPVSLLEAMSAGVVPVVRAIRSGIPELVRHGVSGLLVDPNPEHAATAILSLLNDRALWNKCSRAAKEIVALRFNESRSYEKWISLLENLSATGTIRYPLAIPSDLGLKGIHPLLYKNYPKPRSLSQRVSGKLVRMISGLSR